MKAAVLDGDPNVPNLVAVSYYDQKPVHFLSTICESIHWIQCQKQVYCSETQQLETLKFLRLNVNNDYNHDMGGVDIADQLRNYYRFDHWMRKRKWWWSIFFWAFGVLLVNAYVSYKTYMISKGKRPMSHYEFRKQIALAWIDPTTYWKDRMKNNQQKKPPTTCSTETESRPSRKCSQSVSVASAQSIVGVKKRAIHVNDNTLCPRTGSLCHWLSVHSGAHMPRLSDSKTPKCALHHWGGRRVRAFIVKCGTCGVHLCVDCFEKFHTCQEVDELKKSVSAGPSNSGEAISQAQSLVPL